MWSGHSCPLPLPLFLICHPEQSFRPRQADENAERDLGFVCGVSSFAPSGLVPPLLSLPTACAPSASLRAGYGLHSFAPSELLPGCPISRALSAREVGVLTCHPEDARSLRDLRACPERSRRDLCTSVGHPPRRLALPCPTPPPTCPLHSPAPTCTKDAQGGGPAANAVGPFFALRAEGLGCLNSWKNSNGALLLLPQPWRTKIP
jgi:hypothetical protein